MGPGNSGADTLIVAPNFLDTQEHQAERKDRKYS
jgi:hypothetical protein